MQGISPYRINETIANWNHHLRVLKVALKRSIRSNDIRKQRFAKSVERLRSRKARACSQGYIKRINAIHLNRICTKRLNMKLI